MAAVLAIAAAFELQAPPPVPSAPLAPGSSTEAPPQARPVGIYDLHLAVDVPLTLVLGTAGLVRILWENQLARERCPCDPNELNALDRHFVGDHSHAASIAGDVTVYGIIAALPALDLLDLGVNRALGQDLVVYLETLSIDTFLQNAVNFAVSRPRPRTYENDPSFLHSGEGYLSFYAGHVATAFSAMSAASFTTGHRHGARVWPWLVTAVLAGSVAVERVASGHHFPTDVTVAALVGTAEGITVPWLHLRNQASAHPLMIAPTAAGRGLSLIAAF